jgi:uncharacterized protein affecting Mg2+/Co2+ transport
MKKFLTVLAVLGIVASVAFGIKFSGSSDTTDSGEDAVQELAQHYRSTEPYASNQNVQAAIDRALGDAPPLAPGERVTYASKP